MKKLSHLRLLVALAVAVVLTGCDQGQKAPPKTNLLAVNVAPSFQQLQFRREQETQTNRAVALDFKRSSSYFSYDEDTYDFYVTEPLTSPQPRTWSVTKQVLHGTDYMFVLSEAGGEVTPIIIETPPPAAGANAQIVAMSAVEGAAAMDYYLEPPGAGITGAAPRGTLAFNQPVPALSLPSSQYVITLTEAGNPANVLFTSGTFALPAGLTTGIMVINESNSGTAALSVLLVSETPTLLYDVNATTELRVINGAADTVDRDVAINSEFSPPLFAAVPFAQPTSYVQVPIGTLPVNVTPVGNPGVLELDQTITTTAPQRYTLLFSGNAGTLAHVISADDNRRIPREAKLRFLNAASQFSGVAFVIVPAGEDLTSASAVSVLPIPGISGYSNVAPGDYDLAARDATTLIAGPTRISLAAGGLYGAMTVNGPDASTATIVLLEDFP